MCLWSHKAAQAELDKLARQREEIAGERASLEQARLELEEAKVQMLTFGYDANFASRSSLRTSGKKSRTSATSLTP